MNTMNFVRTADGWALSSTRSAASSRYGNKKGSEIWVRRWGGGELPTVRDFVVPAPVRLAHRIASAAMVRDVAALGAVILFATMVAVLLGLAAPGA